MEKQQLLKLQISVLFVRYKFTFFNTLNEYQSKLRCVFKMDYTQDEIETALNQVEELLIEDQREVIEIPEDFNY